MFEFQYRWMLLETDKFMDPATGIGVCPIFFSKSIVCVRVSERERLRTEKGQSYQNYKCHQKHDTSVGYELDRKGLLLDLRNRNSGIMYMDRNIIEIG